MKLYDSSIWIDFLRSGDAEFQACLESKKVICHPFVIGEVLLGSLSNRSKLERQLMRLPMAEKATDREVLFFLRTEKVFGRGIGWVDTHLLVSAKLTGIPLVSRDKRLMQVAQDLNLN